MSCQFMVMADCFIQLKCPTQLIKWGYIKLLSLAYKKKLYYIIGHPNKQC